jgi:hypothetical protein
MLGCLGIKSRLPENLLSGDQGRGRSIIYIEIIRSASNLSSRLSTLNPDISDIRAIAFEHGIKNYFCFKKTKD